MRSTVVNLTVLSIKCENVILYITSQHMTESLLLRLQGIFEVTSEVLKRKEKKDCAPFLCKS